MFTDRDGKYQLAALAESGFDPLARSTQFMLTEEAHHLFVGETGINRIVERTAELMKADPNEDVKQRGGIPLDVVQKYINQWYSVSLDLFGGEDSSNAAAFFALGLKGRYKESDKERYPDHVATEGVYELEVPGASGKLERQEIPMRRAMNLVLRQEYIDDCHRALKKWNATLHKAGLDLTLSLASERFNRKMGVHTGLHFDPTGEPLSDKAWQAKHHQWLPTDEDRAYVTSLMKPVYEPGQYAGWIAPPKTGINRQPLDFEYVKFAND